MRAAEEVSIFWYNSSALLYGNFNLNTYRMLFFCLVGGGLHVIS